jgi:D-arabinono-1,4-lactone oxidase
MKELGGRPHWAKNFVTTTKEEIWEMYPHMKEWVEIRDEVDPERVFVSEWLKKNVLKDEPEVDVR